MAKRFLLRPMKRMLILLSVLLSGTGIAQASPVAQAVWCAGNRTLYFVNLESVSVGSAFDEQTVTAVWSGEQVTNSYAYMESQSSPYSVAWYEKASSAKTIKFDSSFKDVKPVTLHKWFNSFASLTNIVGIENLNTSEVTSMNCMFTGCHSLTSIDVSTFDMSKVTDVFGMFSACTNLRTIYCNKTWSGIADSRDLFQNTTRLKGYDSSSTDISMANPFTGYFTTKPEMTGTGVNSNPFVITDAAQ